jgi:hypothetical protein
VSEVSSRNAHASWMYIPGNPSSTALGDFVVWAVVAVTSRECGVGDASLSVAS